jgi:hypothetical protein
MKPDCPFCEPGSDQVFLETDLILGLWDKLGRDQVGTR